MADVARYIGLGPSFEAQFTKEAAESNYDNQVKNAIYNDVVKKINNHDIKKLATKPSYKKVLIREFLDMARENVIRNNFPELDLVFTKEYNNPHAVAAASRKCELTTLLDKIGYFRNNATVIDIGGNIVQHFNADRDRIHCCSPILTAYDEHRLTTRTVAMRTNACCSMTPNQARIYDDYCNILLQPNSVTPSICLRPSQNCPVKAELAIALHSLYDIKLADLGKIMVTKGIQMLVGTFIWHPSVLLDDEGTIENLEVTFTKDKTKNTITFSFNDDSSFTYKHDLDTYLSYVVNNSFTYEGNRIIMELQENRSGIQYIKITRSILHSGSIAPLNNNLWFTDRKMCMVKYYSYDGFDTANLTFTDIFNPKVKVTQFRERHFYCEENLVQQGIAHAMRATDTNFKSSQIFSYLVSINRKWYIGGKEIMDRVQISDTSKLQILANVIYVYVYDVIFRQSKAVSMSIDMINYNRSLNEKPLWRKLFSRPNNSYMPIQQDYDQYKWFTCGNFSRKVHALMYNWKKMDTSCCTITKPTQFIEISSINEFLECESTVKLPTITGEIAPPLYDTFKRAIFPALDVNINLEEIPSVVPYDKIILLTEQKIPQNLNYQEDEYNQEKFVCKLIDSNKDCIIKSYLYAFALDYKVHDVMVILRYMYANAQLVGNTARINDVFNSYNFFFRTFMTCPNLYIITMLNQLFPCSTIIHSNVHRNYLTLGDISEKFSIHLLYNNKHVDLLIPKDCYTELRQSKFYEKIDFMLSTIKGISNNIIDKVEQVEEPTKEKASTPEQELIEIKVPTEVLINEQYDCLDSALAKSACHKRQLAIVDVTNSKRLKASLVNVEDYLDGKPVRPSTPESDCIFEPPKIVKEIEPPRAMTKPQPIPLAKLPVISDIPTVTKIKVEKYLDSIVDKNNFELIDIAQTPKLSPSQEETSFIEIDKRNVNIGEQGKNVKFKTCDEICKETQKMISEIKTYNTIVNSSNFVRETLDNNKFDIWLTQSDIANVVRINYPNKSFYFDVIGSIEQMEISHTTFINSTNKLAFFIINDRQHWVLLGILNGKYFFIDPLGFKPAGYIAKYLARLQCDVPYLETLQQRDSYNCGVIVLYNMKRFIDLQTLGIAKIFSLMKDIPSDDLLKHFRRKFALEISAQIIPPTAQENLVTMSSSSDDASFHSLTDVDQSTTLDTAKFKKIFDYTHSKKLKNEWDITTRLHTNHYYFNRCSYKLLEILSLIDSKIDLFPTRALDLGGAPGGFINVLSSKYPLLKIDSVSPPKIPYNPKFTKLSNVKIHRCDHQQFDSQYTYDIILSDMGDNSNYLSQDLFNQSLVYLKKLNKRGVFVTKNSNYFDMNKDTIVAIIRNFIPKSSVYIFKPITSRITNSECYVIVLDDSNEHYLDFAEVNFMILENMYDHRFSLKVKLLDPLVFKLFHNGLISLIDPEIFSSYQLYKNKFTNYYNSFIKNSSIVQFGYDFESVVLKINKLVQFKDKVVFNASSDCDMILPFDNVNYIETLKYIKSVEAAYSLSICDSSVSVHVKNHHKFSTLNFSPDERLNRFLKLLLKYIEFIMANKLFEDCPTYYHYQTNSYETINPLEFNGVKNSHTRSIFDTVFVKIVIGHEHDIFKISDNTYLIKLDKTQNISKIVDSIRGEKIPTVMALYNPALIPQSTVIALTSRMCHHLYLNDTYRDDDKTLKNYEVCDTYYRMFDSIKEIRNYWETNVIYTVNNAKRTYSEYESNQFIGLLTDKSAGILDMASGEWFKKPMVQSSRNYGYCFDGRELVPLEYRNGRYSANTSSRYVLVTKDTAVVISPRLHLLTEEFENLEKIRQIGEFNISGGAPGSGKSSEIVRSCSKSTEEIGDIILTMTKESCLDIRNKLKKFGLNDKLLNRKVKTIDSYILNSTDTCDNLWVDEIFMTHPGTVFIAALKSNAKKINLLGDSAQIPFLNRLDNFNMNYNDYDHLNWQLKPRHHSFRCPRDVIYVINQMNAYGFPITGSNPVINSLNKYVGYNEVDLSADVNLTFTQGLKNSLINKGIKNVFTIHEFQGKEARTVNIIRDNAKDMDVYNSDAHLLVALSRHTHKLNYYTIIQDKLADLIDKSVNCDINHYYKPIEPVAGDTKLLWDVNDHKSEYFQSVPEYVSVRTGNDVRGEASKLAMEIALTNGIPCCNYTVAINNAIHGGEYLYRDKIPFSGVIPLGIDYLQDVYDRLLPGQSRLSREHEQEIISTTSDIRIDECQFSTGVEYKVFRKRSYLTPLLRTSIQPAIESNLSQIMYAYSQRNGGAPEITGTIDREKFVENSFRSFVNTYIDTTKEHLINNLKSEITIDAVSIDKWLNDKPNLRNILRDANKLMDDINLTKYSFILKRNAKPSLDDFSLNKLLAPQTIAFHNKLVNAIFCPIMRIIKARLLAVLKENYLINTDMSLEQFENLFSTRLPPSKAKKYRNTFEVDISKFDKSHNMYLFDLEERILLFLGFPKFLMPYWRWAHTYTTLVNVLYKFRGNVPYQRKSGDPATYLGNTIILMACMASVYDLNDSFCLFSGDDSYIFTNNEPRQSKYLERFATSFNFEAKIINKKIPYFCSKFLVPVTDNRWKIVPDLLKLLTKLGRYDLLNYEHAEMYRVSTHDIMKPVYEEDVTHLVSLALKDRYGASIDAATLISTLLYYTSSKKNFSNLFEEGEGYVKTKITILPTLDI